MIKDFFQLKPLKAAKVSEISEATAAAPVKEEERVNFHIGHPIQDERLTQLYRQLIFEIDEPEALENEETFSAYLEKEQKLPADLIEKARFLYQVIPLCNPYMARGGYSWRNPSPLIQYLQNWFEKGQLETILYDVGQQSGQKELMLGSGGLQENLRILFFTLNQFLLEKPAHILFFKHSLPIGYKEFEHLTFQPLPEQEEFSLEILTQLLKQHSRKPHFLILGAIPGEKFRRELRKLMLHFPLFVVEVNDAPNHFSLAREALLEHRVLRFLTPAVFNKQLADLSTVIGAGRADYIQHLETIYFQLKGTPSAPEAELLYFLLNHTNSSKISVKLVESGVESSGTPVQMAAATLLQNVTNQAQKPSMPSLFQTAESLTQILETKARQISQRWQSHLPQNWQPLPDDAWARQSVWQLVETFFERIHDESWAKQLEEQFLNAFVAVHPEYERAACLAVSGSARTALGILGFHGPIKKVVTFDLGWTYEHCFPQVEVLPINPLDDFSASDVVNHLQKVVEQDTDFLKAGALVINNPHNATGAVIPKEALQPILRWSLQAGLYVIDDLSYQNVGPWQEPQNVPTIRQLVNEQIRQGQLSASAMQKVITCHSLSKTDSFAGARLTVLEIPDADIRHRLQPYFQQIKKHRLPLLIAYLFYRNGAHKVQAYWHLRNQYFAERMATLQKAIDDLPEERNPFKSKILAPRGSMYPLLIIQRLPAGISLDALSTTLANQGIGLVPLTAFARTAAGYQMARQSFRLTLGGKLSGERLYYQTRRVLIDLNRIIAQEASLFQKTVLISDLNTEPQDWQPVLEQVKQLALIDFKKRSKKETLLKDQQSTFQNIFLKERIATLSDQFASRSFLWQQWQMKDAKQIKNQLKHILESEFYKDDLSQRQQRFVSRLFDRTVHPTQIFSIQVDQLARSLIDDFLIGKQLTQQKLQPLARALVDEFTGRSVPINSIQESDELLLDLDALIDAEHLAILQGNNDLQTFLSYWGDWDGSSRPSGQGHRLVAAVLMKNVARMARILNLLLQVEPSLKIDAQLREALNQFPQRRKKFWRLLNEITALTNQLEKRYQSLLPASIYPSRWRKLGMKLHLVRDPLTILWQHNDRLERKMRQLREERRKNLEYYFKLNKQLRKTLYQYVEHIVNHLEENKELFYRAVFYRDLLRRFVLTPRIHQNMITTHDSFAIDTTVFNLNEINELGAQVGNPGLILAMQVSMCSQPQAIIELERKLRARREAILRSQPDLALPYIWTVPLFEEIEVVRKVEEHLEALWNYACNHRSTAQTVEQRFQEMLCEIFIAGSDLSQQVSQTVAAHLYRETSFKVVRWLARKGLAGKIRLKLGSGEPMQRQGGFYDNLGSKPAFVFNRQNKQRIVDELTPSAAKACQFAVTPLRGVLSSGDLRTLQSTVSEKLRMIPVHERANFLFHYKKLQTYLQGEIMRTSEPLMQTRLRFGERGEKELKRLTLGWSDPLFETFLDVRLNNFRQIIYGREEDIVGIHLVSYFVSRMVPAFRDRPTIRPGKIQPGDIGPRVIERLSRVLPQARYGTMLRAIGHNRAQTMILGISQLCTGLFRALKEFSNEHSAVLSPSLLLQERILPQLPVYEILRDLRLYQDIELRFWSKMEPFFPAGNSAVSSLREEISLIQEFVPLLQKELIRRHGLPVNDFFENDHFKANLLPALRPDLAVLLQHELFNTNLERLIEQVKPPVADDWLQTVQHLLEIPRQINFWRQKIWQLIESKVALQVASFVQLAQAIMQLMKQQRTANNGLPVQLAQFQRTYQQVTAGLQSVADENLRQFLLAALEYLAQSRQQGMEIPINVMRALHDVERIVQIESQPLSAEEQQELRFYILQIARLTGENG